MEKDLNKEFIKNRIDKKFYYFAPNKIEFFVKKIPTIQAVNKQAKVAAKDTLKLTSVKS